jgi:hypothetical protein
MKTCNECGETKELGEYHKAKTGQFGVRTTCKTCRSKIAADRYTANWFEQTTKLKKSYCRTHDIPFDLDSEYLENIYTTSCPVFNKTFVRGDKSNDMSPALDRIDPVKGYTKGNVRYICARANRIKYDATVSEIKLVLEYMKEYDTL